MLSQEKLTQPTKKCIACLVWDKRKIPKVKTVWNKKLK
ncbi:hypothetical protein SDC9_198100 [bioreactor metagenome]|uniref:Uncharacterized protein n=1 Tax=bioreactor metagenome TaxID=1076179 RepID=A0A645ITI9_9ZZZZ